MKKLILIFTILLLISCKGRDTILSPKYNQGDTITYENEKYIIAEIDDYYMEINDSIYYWIRPINCDNYDYTMCAFKAREQEITLNK